MFKYHTLSPSVISVQLNVVFTKQGIDTFPNKSGLNTTVQYQYNQQEFYTYTLHEEFRKVLAKIAYTLSIKW